MGVLFMKKILCTLLLIIATVSIIMIAIFCQKPSSNSKQILTPDQGSTTEVTISCQLIQKTTATMVASKHNLQERLKI